MHLLLWLVVSAFALVLQVLSAELLQCEGHARAPSLVAIIVYEAEYLVFGASLGKQTFALAWYHGRLQLFIVACVDLDAHVFSKIGADGTQYEVLAVVYGEELVLNQVRLEALIRHQLEQLINRDGYSEAVSLIWVFVCAEDHSIVLVIKAHMDGSQHGWAAINIAKQPLWNSVEQLFHVV